MKIIRKNETKIFKNSEVCTAFEYEMGDKDINGAVIELSGRYPDKGQTVNEVCKEMAYVVKGSGKLVVEGIENQLAEGDLVLILPGEKFFWQGKMTLFVPCTPAWYPAQHKITE
jgi:mannose-6-phosphate isomerase-like protein (cupin superfamily)